MKEKKEVNRRKFPGVLWLLPIFLGLIGGIVAALIADMKYQASWWELFLVGFIINTLAIIAYFLIVSISLNYLF